jgi:hypothetical protein
MNVRMYINVYAYIYVCNRSWPNIGHIPRIFLEALNTTMETSLTIFCVYVKIRNWHHLRASWQHYRLSERAW